MALIDQVDKICKRLETFGWASLLKRHGLDILSTDLETELHRDISGTIDRRIPGFMDFTHSGHAGIQPYNPPMSLLYHALASPNVHPGPGNFPVADSKAYPSIEELDVIENYIFSTEHPKGTIIRDQKFFEDHFQKKNLVIAVFAYQYRPGIKSVHGHYADFCYSRTGIARIGTRDFQFIGSNRSFWPVVRNESHQFCVMPARYGVFLSEIRKRAAEREVMFAQKTDDELYVFPLHKLFSGPGCIGGQTIPEFDFLEEHVSEKLRLLFLSQDPNSKFKLNKDPFIRRSGDGLQLKLLRNGFSTFLIPVASPVLVEEARQDDKIVNFIVPPGNENDDRRYSTSLQIENTGRFQEARIGPEYANIRFELDKMGKISNLSNQFSASREPEFLKKINKGGYKAVVFTDNSCDGCIEVKFSKPIDWVSGFLPAFSLVTAPDFFPLCDQSDIVNWENKNEIKDQFRQGGTDPLFTTRKFVNPGIRSSITNTSAFDNLNTRKIRTTTAIVSMSVLSAKNPKGKNNQMQVSWLPDAASGYFAPGWDVTLVTTENVGYDFLSTSGLGSPFPEDTKLCAALNSFWPAVAPDASRTFISARVAPGGTFKTALPLTDDELGYHPLHSKVINRSVKSSSGWDGEQGPFFQKNFTLVNFCSIDRSDYTNNMMNNLFSIDKLSLIDANEWINRMIAMRNCIFVLPPPGDRVSKTKLSLVTFEKIKFWEEEPEELTADSLLSGPGFLFEFALLSKNEKKTTDPKRRTKEVVAAYTCQLSDRFLFWKNHTNKKFNKVNRGTIPLKW